MKCAVRIAATHLLRQREPRRFVTDRSFNFQIVRQLLSLAPQYVTYGHEGKRRVQQLDRRIPPKAIAKVGDYLNTAYARWIVQVLRAVERERLRPNFAKDKLAAAFDSLPVNPKYRKRERNATFWRSSSAARPRLR